MCAEYEQMLYPIYVEQYWGTWTNLIIKWCSRWNSIFHYNDGINEQSPRKKLSNILPKIEVYSISISMENPILDCSYILKRNDVSVLLCTYNVPTAWSGCLFLMPVACLIILSIYYALFYLISIPCSNYNL